MAVGVKRLATLSGPYRDAIPIDASGGDVDLTDPAGPTGGYCARAVLVGTGGNLVFRAIGLPNPGAGYSAANRTVALADNQTFPVAARLIAQASTASGIIALL